MIGRRLVAINLRRLRVTRALSQEALAVDAGLDRSYIGRLERGAENPTVDTLDRLGLALHVETRAFLKHPEPGEELPPTLPRGRRARK
ncbi:MAG: helix-turn-helix domain-containing protein [Janthinobacterium lividum]